ncbi:MAG: hypothetical protein K8R46_13870, partial [Pirellulales bacterium]|nr:hypothetical protein [Pirellulales bacterium]
VTSYSFSGLAYSTTHYWKIIPYNANGDATGCSIWSFTTPIPVATPASEDFETFTVASNATGYTNGWSTSPSNTSSQFRWNVDNGGTPSSYTGPEVDHTTGTASGIYLFTEASSGSQNDEAYVYSPVYDLSGLSNPQIKFWYHMYGSKMGELHLDINAGSGWINDIATPLIGQQQTAQEDPWLEKAASLNAYSGQIVKFRFRGIRGNGSSGDMSIDDVSLEEIPTCPAPSGLTTTNITLTTADLDWTENGPATTWEVEWGQTGFTQGSGTTITGITSHPYTLNPPLTPATTYDWYVKSVCGMGDTSIYEGPETFTTLCNPFTAPFSENFDEVTPPDLPNCWYKIVEFVYAYIETSTTSANSPPNSIVMFSSYSPSSAVILTTPQLSDLTSQSNQIRFYAKSDQLSNLIIGTMSDPMDVATFTAYQTINLTATYSEYVIMFGSTYTGTDEYIAFKHGASSNMNYINIDDFVYEAMPACPTPTLVYADNVLLTTATLNWTENGAATTWNIEVGEPGFTPGTGNAIQTYTGVTTNPFDILNLTQGTTYDFYVQADCGGGSTSTWEGASFTTILPGINCTYPYMITEANFPFSQTGWTTCGFGDDYSNADACNSYYMNGEDFVFEYIPVDNININIILTNTLDYTGLFVTNGCPDVGTCAYYDVQEYGNPALYNIALTGGTTYYIIVSTWPAPDCTGFDIYITDADAPEYLFQIKVFLEGPFNGTDMNTYLNPADLPLSQPYNTAPWNYTGTESVAFIPNADIVDWVLVELRDTTEAQYASGSTMIARQAAFILNDGSIVGLDGTSILTFNVAVENNLFAVIRHRNHLSVMSANPLIEIGGIIYNYDFTTGADKAYGGENGHKEIGTGIWGMIGGDGNVDNQIGNADKNDIWEAQTGGSGYLSGDFSMDGQCNNSDKIEVWAPNSGSGGQVP